MGLRIVSTGKALPKRCVTNDDLSKLVDTSDEWIVERTGIKARYQCKEETALSLAVEAAGYAIEKAQIDKTQIGLVIVATTTAEALFPSVACMLQKELMLPEEVMAFDVSAACTGFIYSMGIAETLMKKKYALLVGTEQLSSIIDYSDRGTCILFGDGAGAAVVEKTDSLFLQKSWARGNETALYCERVGAGNHYLSMRGNDVFRFAVTALEQAIREVLAEAQLSLEDIEMIFCHQANERIIGHVAKRIGVTAEKMPVNISQYGNTSAASIPILLSEMQEKLETGKKYICVGFGAGLTWSAMLFEQ